MQLPHTFTDLQNERCDLRVGCVTLPHIGIQLFPVHILFHDDGRIAVRLAGIELGNMDIFNLGKLPVDSRIGVFPFLYDDWMVEFRRACKADPAAGIVFDFGYCLIAHEGRGAQRHKFQRRSFFFPRRMI